MLGSVTWMYDGSISPVSITSHINSRNRSIFVQVRYIETYWAITVESWNISIFQSFLQETAVLCFLQGIGHIILNIGNNVEYTCRLLILQLIKVITVI